MQKHTSDWCLPLLEWHLQGALKTYYNMLSSVYFMLAYTNSTRSNFCCTILFTFAMFSLRYIAHMAVTGGHKL